MAYVTVAGDAVRINVEIRDHQKVLQNATSITITIKDAAAAVKVNGAAMLEDTAEGTGRYYYVFQSATTDSSGTYTAVISAVVSSQTGSQKISFELQDD